MCGPSHKDRATEWEDKGPDHRLGALFYSCGSTSVRARSGWHTPLVGGNKWLSQDGYRDGTLEKENSYTWLLAGGCPAPVWYL